MMRSIPQIMAKLCFQAAQYVYKEGANILANLSLRCLRMWLLLFIAQEKKDYGANWISFQSTEVVVQCSLQQRIIHYIPWFPSVGMAFISEPIKMPSHTDYSEIWLISYWLCWYQRSSNRNTNARIICFNNTVIIRKVSTTGFLKCSTFGETQLIDDRII